MSTDADQKFTDDSAPVDYKYSDSDNVTCEKVTYPILSKLRIFENRNNNDDK